MVEKRLVFREEHIKTLVSLGLNGTQAKICLTLSVKGTSTVKEIADASKIARPDTYRALLELENKALIEKTISNPAKYTMLPLPEALSMLMGQKEAESKQIQEKASELLQDYEIKLADQEPENKGEFVLVPNGKAFTNRLNMLLEKSCKNVWIISDQKNLDLFLEGIEEKLAKAYGREVNLRIVTERKTSNSLTGKLQTFQENLGLEVRFANIFPPFSLAVFDEKEVLLLMKKPYDNSQFSATYSSNPSMVELAQNYFNDAWYAAGQPSDLSLKRTPEQLYNKSTSGLIGQDIRNPLQSILSDAFLIKSDLSSLPEGEAKEGIKESLAEIEENIQYVNKIVQKLQESARPNKLVVEETSSEKPVDQTLFKDETQENNDVSPQAGKKAKKDGVDAEMQKHTMNNIW